VIRLRGNIHITDASGETRTAANWVGRSGRARKAEMLLSSGLFGGFLSAAE
jgi:hypothetical protein